jgi:hypothetical protein
MSHFEYILAVIFVYSLVYAAYTCLSIPVATFLLAYVVPKPIIKKYFRQPHFNDGDDELFELFPFRYYLTLWIAQLTACEWFAYRRKAYDLRKDSPRYWRVLAWIYWWLIFVPPVLAFTLSCLALMYFELTGRPIPKT